MERIVITHLSGLKANQEEKFPLSDFKEIAIGRDPSSGVRYNDEAGSVVSRQHARITRNIAFPSQFFITDLNSRNGTFVNGQRVVGTISLRPGDVVQCGVGGPKFQFIIEPETDRLGEGESPAPTADLLDRARAQRAKQDLPFAAPAAPAVKTNAERPSAPAGKRSGRRLIAGVIFTGIIALGAGFLFYRGFGSSGSGEAGKSAATPGAPPNANVENVSRSGPAAEAEEDPQRAAWRIEVAPHLTLGSGRPGTEDSDFDRLGGVAFSPAGLLFVTDAGNRRVQVWDVKTGSRLGEFGHGVFGGETADIAIGPDNRVLVTDRTLNLAYAFAPPRRGATDKNGNPLGPYDYQLEGARFGEQGFRKLGGVAVDSRKRVYVVDSLGGGVRRFNPDGAPDQTWKFEETGADDGAGPRGYEGIAIDEAARNLFVAGENDAVIEVFDLETGAYKKQFIGASKDASGKPAGKSVFFGSVRGMTVARRHLLAVDEGAGHIQIFNLARPDAFDTDLAGYAEPQPVRSAGYQGFLVRAPLVDFEDKTNADLQRQVKDGSIVPGQANPPGYFCSPGSIASHTDRASGETYIAVADQCNHRVVIYRWSDIAKATGVADPPAGATLATSAARPVSKPAGALVSRKPVAPRNKNAAPVRRRVAPASVSKGVVKSDSRKKAKEMTGSRDGAVVDSKKAKKAKKEKKAKIKS